jgi:hypothetical protein
VVSAWINNASMRLCTPPIFGGPNTGGGEEPPIKPGKPPGGRPSVRAPDYLSVNVNVAIPNPITGLWVGWSGQANADVYGNMYFAPLKGFTVGRSATFVSGSATAGWMWSGRGRPRERYLRNFLSGVSKSVGAGNYLGGGITWNDNGWAWEVGLVTPQAGFAYHNAKPDFSGREPSDLDPMIDWWFP